MYNKHLNIVLGVSSKSFSDVCTYAYRMKKSTDRIRNVQLFLTKQKKSTKTKKQLIDCTLSVLRIFFHSVSCHFSCHFESEFESIETSAGFAQLLGENWN